MVNYKLNNWAVLCGVNSQGMEEARLVGEVEGHPLKPDGTIVITALPIGREGDKLVTATGSRITLGEPKPDYEEMFPNAKHRILSSAPVLQ